MGNDRFEETTGLPRSAPGITSGRGALPCEGAAAGRGTVEAVLTDRGTAGAGAILVVLGARAATAGAGSLRSVGFARRTGGSLRAGAAVD